MSRSLNNEKEIFFSCQLYWHWVFDETVGRSLEDWLREIHSRYSITDGSQARRRVPIEDLVTTRDKSSSLRVRNMYLHIMTEFGTIYFSDDSTESRPDFWSSTEISGFILPQSLWSVFDFLEAAMVSTGAPQAAVLIGNEGDPLGRYLGIEASEVLNYTGMVPDMYHKVVMADRAAALWLCPELYALGSGTPEGMIARSHESGVWIQIPPDYSHVRSNIRRLSKWFAAFSARNGGALPYLIRDPSMPIDL